MCFRSASTRRQRCIPLLRPTHTALDANIPSKCILKVRRPRRNSGWNWTRNSGDSRNWRWPPPCRVSLLNHREAGEWTKGESALARCFKRRRDALEEITRWPIGWKEKRSNKRTVSAWISVRIPFKSFLHDPTAMNSRSLYLSLMRTSF